MSVRVMSWVFEHSKSSGNDRLVLLAIADRCDDDGGNCWNSTEKLAAKAKVSKRTAQRCIDHLIEMGELVAEPRAGKTSVLAVVMDKGRQVDAPTGDKLTPRQVDARDTGDAPGVTTVTPDTSIHPLTPQPPADAAGVGDPDDDHCTAHTRFRRNCRYCQRKRTARIERETKARLAAAQALDDCNRCDPDGWEFDDEGGPTARRCDHRRTA